MLRFVLQILLLMRFIKQSALHPRLQFLTQTLWISVREIGPFGSVGHNNAHNYKKERIITAVSLYASDPGSIFDNRRLFFTVFMLAFAYSGVMLFGNQYSDFVGLQVALLKMWNMLLGDFDTGMYMDGEKYDVFKVVWFLLFFIVGLYLLMNMVRHDS